MSVRAKFSVQSITRTAHAKYPHKKADGTADYSKPEPTELHTIRMNPVYGNGNPNHENTKFWESSPSGSLELGTVNPEAVKQFEIGKEYYVDFTPAT